MKKQYAMLLGLGTEFVGLVAAFLFIGHWIDGRFGWNGFGMIGGVLLALAIWSAHFAFVARSLSREEGE